MGDRDPGEIFARAEIAKRQRLTEGLAIYRPSEKQLAFHRSKAREKLVRGGKQSGKSMCAAAEVASRCTGIPIIGPNGKPIKTHWPVSTPRRPLTVWVIGWAEKHIGQTIHRLLFQPGMKNAFRYIRDRETEDYRAFNYGDPDDVARIDESGLCGPLIPERMIESWAWDSRATNVFEACHLTNGCSIYAFPSSSRTAKMGESVDLIWIDEDIQNPDHYAEWQDRLGLRGGTIIWSVWPQMRNGALLEMLNRAEEQAELPPSKRDVEAVQLISSENPWIPEEERQRGLRRMGDEDTIARRDRGELLMDEYAMYDFTPASHLLVKTAESQLPDNPQSPLEILTDLYSRTGTFPKEWTRYLSVDPSHTRTAVLSFVVTPKTWNVGGKELPIGSRVIVEWEAVAKKALADDLARGLIPLMKGNTYEAFIMDQNKGRQTNAGERRNTFQVYSEAFESIGIQSRLTRYGFLPGCNKPDQRYGCVRELMATRLFDLPLLMLCDQHTPATRKEFGTYNKKELRTIQGTTILDEPANPRKHDCMAALEYGVTYLRPLLEAGTAFRVDATQVSSYPDWVREIQDMNKNQKRSIHLGPGLNAA